MIKERVSGHWSLWHKEKFYDMRLRCFTCYHHDLILLPKWGTWQEYFNMCPVHYDKIL